jgi:dUTP pyrophosphatase
MKIKVIDRSAHGLPHYETPLAAGLDVRANIEESIVLRPLERVVVPTGLSVELPEGYEMQIRPRSGMAARHGLTVLNTPGTIDPDYRGEIGVIVANLSATDYELKPGERIAQMVVARFERIEWEPTDTLSSTERGSGGFGHTGK